MSNGSKGSNKGNNKGNKGDHNGHSPDGGQERVAKKYRICQFCWFWSDEFTSVCVNDQSPHRGDFVNREDVCPYFDLDERRYEHGNG